MEFSHSEMAIAVFEDNKLVELQALDALGYRPETLDIFRFECPERALSFINGAENHIRVSKLSSEGSVYLVQRISRRRAVELGECEFLDLNSGVHFLQKLKKIAA